MSDRKTEATENKTAENQPEEKKPAEKKPAADADHVAGSETARKRRPIERVLAILALAILLGLLVWLVICIATGSKYTMAVLFLVILYPILIYLFFWIKKVFSK